MFPNRIRITKEASEQIKWIKARTRVSPNILCRLALAHSLKAKKKINRKNIDLNGIEFHSSTLFGNYIRLFESLFRQIYGKLTIKESERIVAAHVDDGIKNLRTAKSPLDLTR